VTAATAKPRSTSSWWFRSPVTRPVKGHGGRPPGRRLPDADPPTGTGSLWTAGWGRECAGAGGVPAGLEGPRPPPERRRPIASSQRFRLAGSPQPGHRDRARPSRPPGVAGSWSAWPVRWPWKACSARWSPPPAAGCTSSASLPDTCA